MTTAAAPRVRFEEYVFPFTVEECVRQLAEYDGRARIIAGGTDLVLWARNGKIEQNVMVDISRVEGINDLVLDSDKLILGAGMTHASVASNREVKSRFTALADACRSVGSPQIRHIATLGGNIVSAQPAADSVIPMVALDAKCEIVSSSGTRVEPIDGLHEGVGRSKVDPTREVLSRIFLEIPRCPYATAFTRLAPREAMALPIVNCAILVLLDGDSIISARIALAPVATRPFRPVETEAFLAGKKISDPKIFEEAARIASSEAKPRDSLLRGSGEYRKVLVGDLIESALRKAADDIKEGA